MTHISDYNISYIMNGKILEVEMSGDITNTNGATPREEIIRFISKEKPAAVLIDVRTLKGRYKITDMYYEVRKIPEDTPILSTAIVDLKEQEKFNTFLETTSQNMGMPTKWFTDIDSAREWLKLKL